MARVLAVAMGVLVFVAISLLNGCSLLGAGVGATIDASHSERYENEPRKTRRGGYVSLGSHISALMKDGSSISGEVRGRTGWAITVRDDAGQFVVVYWSEIDKIKGREIEVKDPIWDGAAKGFVVGFLVDVLLLASLFQGTYL